MAELFEARKPKEVAIISEIDGDFTSKMRDNAKLLFSVALDEDRIQSLLNNHTVDEVITILLKMAK